MSGSDSREPARVLVVDDDPALRRSLERVLRLAHYDVALAEDGRAALEALGSDDFSIVILDIAMPPPDGLEVCRRHLRRSWRPNLGDQHVVEPSASSETAPLGASIRASLDLPRTRVSSEADRGALHAGPAAAGRPCKVGVWEIPTESVNDKG